MKPGIYTIILPVKRPFRWRVLGTLVVLLFLANLAAIPLLRATNAPIEPAWYWGVYTAVTAVLISLGLYLGSRIGLGAPLIEGLLGRDEIGDWAHSLLAWGMLSAVVGSLIILPANLNANSEHYPASWLLILASIKAGVMEEITMRILLMSFFVWLGSLISKTSDGRPTRAVFWVAIVLCALLFGWSHVDARLAMPGITASHIVFIMGSNTFLGIVLGWLFWKLGLECAMFAHFMIDAIVSGIVMPVYFSRNPLLQIELLIGLIIAAALSVRVLTRTGSKAKCGGEQ
jgi:hypothetical protein